MEIDRGVFNEAFSVLMETHGIFKFINETTAGKSDANLKAIRLLVLDHTERLREATDNMCAAGAGIQSRKGELKVLPGRAV